MNNNQEYVYDIAICGAGLSGLASAILLSRLNMKVICIEPTPFPHNKIGESFDWSTPNLLASVGITAKTAVDKGYAIPKTFVKITSNNDKIAILGPKKWMEKRPLKFETVTIHADRKKLDKSLHQLAIDEGVIIIQDRVNDIIKSADKIEYLITKNKIKINANWFVDASGSAQVFGRKLKIKKTDYGPTKIAMWSTFLSNSTQHGTSLYGNINDNYLSWIWSIPIQKNEVSVGCVMSAENAKKKLKSGKKVKEIYEEELTRNSCIFEVIEEGSNDKVKTCKYTPYAYQKVYGDNWMIIGEAAAMHDALTSNGVTNGLRHAHDVVRIIQKRGNSKKLFLSMKNYNTKIRLLSHLFNYGVEKIIYEKHLRQIFGLEVAARFYAKLAFTMNVIYSRIKPHTFGRMFFFKMIVFMVLSWFYCSKIIGKGIHYLMFLFKK